MSEAEIALIGAAIGAAAGLLGTIVTLLIQAYRERRAWQRDQAARSTLQFLREVRRVDLMLSRYNRVGEEGDTLPDPDWRAKVAMDLAEMEVYGSEDLARAGQSVYQSLHRLEAEGGTVGSMMEMDEAVARYRKVLQRDLGLPITDLSPTDVVTTEPLEEQCRPQSSRRRWFNRPVGRRDRDA